MTRIESNADNIHNKFLLDSLNNPFQADKVETASENISLLTDAPVETALSGDSLITKFSSKVGIDRGEINKFELAQGQTNAPILVVQRPIQRVSPTDADRKVGNAGDVVNYGASSVSVVRDGKTVNVPVNEIVNKASLSAPEILNGLPVRHATVNGTKFYLDYHGVAPARVTFTPAKGENPVSGVIVKNGNNYSFVEDKPLNTLGVQSKITEPGAKPWRELGIPDWRQKQLQSVANDYMTRELPNIPGANSEPRRTSVNPKTDTNIAAGNDGRKHPVLNYSDLGKVFAAVAKDQRLTDSEKFEVSRLISEGYGKRQDGAGSVTNTLLGRKYLLSSQFSRPENADSGVHKAFPFGGRPFAETDHGTHIVNGANYADNRHAGWLQRDLFSGKNDTTIINNFRNRATREETIPLANTVNRGDVDSSVNASRALLAGYRQSQITGGKGGYAAFAIQWIRGAVEGNEGEKIIRDFRLNDELRKR